MIERYEIVNKYDDTPVGANPCVRPLNAQNIRLFGLIGQIYVVGNKGETEGFESNGQTHDIKRQTHGSAPTEKIYKHNRRSIRLPYYDYSRAGYYFITIRAHNREHLFGEIVDGHMVLNVAGEMVRGLWYEITNDFPNVALHDFVVMPNHIHGIIQIKYRGTVGVPLVGTLNVDGEINCNGIHNKRAPIKGAPTVGNIIGAFKSKTTNTYITMVKNNTLPPFNKRIWQRNYYEHVVRDENDYVRIAEYIENNPSTWNDDMLNT